MKKATIIITSLACICVLSIRVNAQTTTTTTTTTVGTNGGTTFGIKAGVNFYNINGKEEGTTLSNKLKPGFTVGVNAEIPIAPGFYFQPGLSFITKGTKVTQSGYDAKYTLNYLELPLNLIYKAGLTQGNVLLGFGPYLGYGIGGKIKTQGTSTDIKFKSTPGTDVNTVYYKPFDAGLNLLAGYEFTNRLSVQLDAQLGVVNINAYNNNAKYHNTGFGASLEYRF